MVKNEGVLPIPVASKPKVLVLSPDLLPVTPLGEMASSEMTLSHLQIDGAETTFATFPHLPEMVAVHHLLEQCSSYDYVVLTIYARDRVPDSSAR